MANEEDVRIACRRCLPHRGGWIPNCVALAQRLQARRWSSPRQYERRDGRASGKVMHVGAVQVMAKVPCGEGDGSDED